MCVFVILAVLSDCSVCVHTCICVICVRLLSACRSSDRAGLSLCNAAHAFARNKERPPTASVLNPPLCLQIEMLCSGL